MRSSWFDRGQLWVHSLGVALMRSHAPTDAIIERVISTLSTKMAALICDSSMSLVDLSSTGRLSRTSREIMCTHARGGRAPSRTQTS